MAGNNETDFVQPANFAFDVESESEIPTLLAKYPPGKQASAVLPMLYLVQNQMKRQTGSAWVPTAGMDEVARRLDMAPIRVYEVATFYLMFNLRPIGNWHLQVCTTTPCWLRGSDEVVAACRAVTGIQGWGETSSDGMFTMTEVECVGACVNAPVIQVNDDFYEDLDAEGTKQLLEALRRGEQPKPGSTKGRQTSAPEGGADNTDDTAFRRGELIRCCRTRTGSSPTSTASTILTLKGARSRGDWDNTKAILEKGRDAIVEEVKASGLRGRGGAGFPDRAEMVVHAEAVGPALLSGGERRRERAWHLQGSRHHAPRSAQADRRLPCRRLRDGRVCSVHLHPRRVRQRGEVLQAAIDEAYAAGLIGKNACELRLCFRRVSFTVVPVPISAARKPALLESLEGKKGLPRLKPPFPAAVGLYGCPIDGEQRREHRGSADHHAARSSVVQFARPAEELRAQGVLHFRPCEQAVQCRGRAWHSVARTDRQIRRRRARRLGQSAGGHSGRRVGAGDPEESSATTC